MIISKFQVLEEGKTEMTDKTPEIKLSKKIIINPSHKFHEIRFGILDFGNIEQHRYAFKIDGYIDNWTYINENSIRLTGLPYGDFELKIKGQGANGKWSKHILNLAIYVTQPFYLKKIFWVPLLLLALLSIYGLVKYRVRNLERNQRKLEKEVLKRTYKIQQQAEKLKEIDEIKSRFFTNVTHELRTPITLILGPLKDLLKKEPLSDHAKSALEKIEKSTNNLLRLTEEILDLSKMEANKLVLEETKVVLHPLIRRIFSSFSSYARYRNIDLELRYEVPEFMVLRLDAKKFEKILNNLLSNAFKFTSERGTVILSIKDFENRIQIQVSDTGTGISEEDLPYIFDRFFQTKKESSENLGGSGIGLSLSREYAKLMGGSLSVKSTIDLGSSFYFTFPKKEIFTDIPKIEKESEFILPPTSVYLHKPSISHQILLAEDNLDMANYIESIMPEPFKLLKADNGKTALTYLEKNKNISLIISDVMMPEMNGFEFLEQVKNHPTWKNIPFIMLTARVESVDKLEAFRIGVDDYISKPFESEELLARITNLLLHYNTRKETQEKMTAKVGIKFEPEQSVDTQWIENLEKIVKENISDNRLNVQYLSEKMAISERQLRTKIKLNTGLSPSQYLREARLLKARTLLESKAFITIAEICYAVGFKNPAHFTQLFRARFGKLPSDYME